MEFRGEFPRRQHRFKTFPKTTIMKSLLLAGLLTGVSSVSGFAQGTVGSVTYSLFPAPGKSLFVYGVDESNPTVMVQGNSASYANRTLIVTSTYRAELWAGSTEANLAPVVGSLTKYVPPGGAIDTAKKLDIPGTHGGDIVFMQLRVWADVASSWGDLVNHPEADFGMSKPFSMRLGGSAEDGTLYLPLHILSSGLERFGLARVPEPSVVGLAVVGFGALALYRRKG